jgi:hypothetical protein
LKQNKQSFPFTIDAALAAKLGSILVHVEEGRSSAGHAFDWLAVDALMADAAVLEWIRALQKIALVPLKRARP